MKKLTIVLALLCVFSVSFSYAADRYELIDLGRMVKARSSGALSINNEGIVVGFLEYTMSGWWYQRAVKWKDMAGKILPLFDPETTSYGIADSINDNNVIVGAMDGYGERPLACIWHSDGVNEMLPITGWAVDINNNFEVLVSTGYAYETIIWNDGDWETIISAGLNGVDVSIPNAINDSSRVVGQGYIYEADHDYEFAFLWVDGTLFDLNDVSTNPWLHLRDAKDINNYGQIVGYYGKSNKSYLFFNRKVRKLGFTGAKAINEKGQIVGGHFLYKNFQKVTRNGKLIDFRIGKLFDLYDIIETTIEYEELEVVDINNKGQIVGSALIDGSTHAVLLNPSLCRQDRKNHLCYE